MSYLKYWNQTLCMPIISIGYALSATYNGKEFLKYYHLLNDTCKTLTQINIPIKLQFIELYFLHFLQILTSIVVLAADIYVNGYKYDIFYYYCQYLPSFSINLYVICVFYFWISSWQIFVSINNILKPLCCNSLTHLEKFALSKKKIKPGPLLEKLNLEDKTCLEKIMEIHDTTCFVIKKLENTTLCEFTLFIYFTVSSLLSVTYDASMDLKKLFVGIKLESKTNFAVWYWPMMSFFLFLYIIRLGTKVMNNANATKCYLGKLVNLYPDLNKYVSYFFLFHKITGAKFH